MADAEHADALALLYALLGGIFMGAYPAPIKASAVLKANPHPIVFQCYKSFWVFVTGWLFVIANVVRRQELVFEFTWWGVVSAAAWIPSGVCTIAAVPRLGLGMAIAVITGTSSVLSFLVFWLVLGESMKEHMVNGSEFYTAPIYLICAIFGMVAMVAAPGDVICKREPPAGNTRDDGAASSAPLAPGRTDGAVTEAMTGLFFALSAGVFSAVQFGAVNFGKREAEHAHGCADNPSACPAVLKEQFNNFGSWMASFGIGGALVTSVVVVVFAFLTKARGQPLSFHFDVLKLPGSLAGLLWCLGNVFQTAAIVRGGDAVMLPANQSIQLMTSGAFGLIYYREVRQPSRAVAWALAALWTLAAIILLSKERSS